MNMIIRKMTIDDIEQVIAIDRLSFSLPWPERSFRFELTDNPASRCWVAEIDAKLVGVIVAWLIVDEIHIATIATHPDFRRRGVARKLMAYALQNLKEEGAQSSFLEVRASNFAAQDMYRKFGYEETGVRPRYYKDNDEDALLMTLESLDVEKLEDQEV
jgi:ribosomal-protein-alanine N-acetyltransferase